MSFVKRKPLFTLVVITAVALLLIAGFVWSGVYNIGADDSHTRPVYAVLETLRERSIDTRAAKLQVPSNLNDPARIRQGSGNYDAMCTGCHLAPGAEETELSKGLYPKPPNLAKQPVDPTHAFWVIKHGIKASGMPAWGKSMEDEYIWNMAAFLQKLPKLDAEQYKALVASSGGHSHGGGETGGHSHAEGMEDHHHEEGESDHHHEDAENGHDSAAQSHDTTSAANAGVTHVHADGTTHIHAAPVATKATDASKTTEPTMDEHPEHEHQR
jgi:mono/diheme cytochrome c family protein